jgi:threonine aldolase
MTPMLDFRSDTGTLPSSALRLAMVDAEVGDDYYGEDPSVRRLEDVCRERFEKEAAVFTTTGMLANQLAISTQARRGHEVVTEYGYHVHLYESAQHAAYSQVVLNPCTTHDGVLRVADVARAIASKPREPIYAQVDLVSVENTIGSRAGRVFPIDELRALRAYTRERGIRLHLDGARLFHAHLATGVALAEYARQADTVSICFSKGLGAPLGSMLMGPRDSIEHARRLRVWHGSGFHKAGFCASAALFALTHQMDRLVEDHHLARLLAERLEAHGGFGVAARDVETNMVFLDASRWTADPASFQALCAEHGLRVSIVPPAWVRLVVCRDVDAGDVENAARILVRVAERLAAAHV